VSGLSDAWVAKCRSMLKLSSAVSALLASVTIWQKHTWITICPPQKLCPCLLLESCRAIMWCCLRDGKFGPFWGHRSAWRCRTLVVANCGPIPTTCGSCSCREHITNSVIGVSRPPVLDCGTTFHLDYGGRDLPSTPSDNLWKLIYLATEALSDSFEFIGAI